MSFKAYLSIFTAVAIILIIYFSRHELVTAWRLLEDVNFWILLLLIPVQFISYYAVGAMIFEYLKSKGDLTTTSKATMTRIALELNFVNHTLPSGGISGISYLNWRLKHLGVSGGRATMAQVVRFIASFGVYLVLLLIALVLLTIDGGINRFTVLFSSMLGMTIIFGSLFVLYIIGSEVRLKLFSRSVSRWLSRVSRHVLRRRSPLVQEARIQKFFEDLHDDYLELRREPGVLKKPIIWAFVFNIAEIAMFILAFGALGTWINPAPLLIAYGIAGLAGIVVITPGGAGAYEALMIFFLGTSGISPGVAIAGILLTRVILITGTIISGYIFYQLAILRYGKSPVNS